MRAKPIQQIIDEVESAFLKLEEFSSDLSKWDESPYYKDLIDGWIELKMYFIDNPPKDGIIQINYRFLYLHSAAASTIVEQMLGAEEHAKRVKLADIWYGLSGVLDDIIEIAQDLTNDAQD